MHFVHLIHMHQISYMYQMVNYFLQRHNAK